MRRRRLGVWWLTFGLGILLLLLSVALVSDACLTSEALLFFGIVLMIGSVLWRSAARSPLRGLPLDDPRMAHYREFNDAIERSRARDRERIGPETEDEKYDDAMDGMSALGTAVVKDVLAEREEKRRLESEARKRGRGPDGP